MTEEEIAIEYTEIDGLSSTDSDSDEDYDDYDVKKPSKVKFSRSPIKVSSPTVELVTFTLVVLSFSCQQKYSSHCQHLFFY